MEFVIKNLHSEITQGFIIYHWQEVITSGNDEFVHSEMRASVSAESLIRNMIDKMITDLSDQDGNITIDDSTRENYKLLVIHADREPLFQPSIQLDS